MIGILDTPPTELDTRQILPLTFTMICPKCGCALASNLTLSRTILLPGVNSVYFYCGNELSESEECYFETTVDMMFSVSATPVATSS